jgi:hypothetical protein
LLKEKPNNAEEEVIEDGISVMRVGTLNEEVNLG